MRKSKVLAALFAGILVLSACGDTTVEDVEDGVTSLGEAADNLPPEVTETVDEVQADVTNLATEVQNSAAAAELEESWNSLQTEVVAALAAIGDDGMVDGTEVTDAIDDFQADLDALGDEVEPTLAEAWDTFRQRLEGMMS